jgi:1-acyl-sn-glycerol-3-phosphate acyltransferase
MTFDTFKKIFDVMNESKTMTQIAFGVDAEASEELNPDIWKIFEYTKNNGVTPNVTVADITPYTAEKIVSLCGACAVSAYQSNKNCCYDSIRLLLDEAKKQGKENFAVNIHLMISKETLPFVYEVINDYQTDSRLDGMNAIVFLSLKQKGRGEYFNKVTEDEFKNVIDICFEKNVKFGMDSCSANKFLKAIEGKENLPEGNVLFVANHSNWIDAFIILSIVDRPTAMVIAKEANWEKFPILSGWLDMFNCLHLDRENNRAALKTMNEASNLLKETSSVGIFPEGMVTRSNDIGEFKSGAFRMAIKSQVPIVPILIENSKDVYIPSIGFKIGKSYSKQVSVKILPPVYDHIENPKIKSSVISDLVRNTLIENQEEIFEVSDADLCMETNLI